MHGEMFFSADFLLDRPDIAFDVNILHLPTAGANNMMMVVMGFQFKPADSITKINMPHKSRFPKMLEVAVNRGLIQGL